MSASPTRSKVASDSRKSASASASGGVPPAGCAATSATETNGSRSCVSASIPVDAVSCAGNPTVSVSGFAGPDMLLLDITDGKKAKLVKGAVVSQGSSG